MKTPEGFDLIQDAIADTEIDVSIAENAAYGDMALHASVQDRDIIERLHAEQFLFRHGEPPSGARLFESARRFVAPVAAMYIDAAGIDPSTDACGQMPAPA